MNVFAVVGLVPAFLIGTVAWLATGRNDAVALLTAGTLLLSIDGALRLRRRKDVPRWLIAPQAGGVLFVFPVWLLGVVQIGAAINAFAAPPRSRAAVASAPSARAATSTSTPRTASSPSTSSEMAFSVVENIELVPYCLPYPTSLKDDLGDHGAHGRHAFVSTSGTTKLVLDTSCGPRSHAELHKEDVAKLRAANPGMTFDFDSLRSDGYVVSWHVGRSLHFGRLWTAPDGDGCFVRAFVDAEESERATFDAIARKLTSATPRCSER